MIMKIGIFSEKKLKYKKEQKACHTQIFHLKSQH